MPILKKDIRRAARLARLELTSEEFEKLSKDLAQIIAYIDQIKEVETDGIIPQSLSIRAENIFREDKIKPSLPKIKALRNAPEKDKDYFRVPKVIG